MTTITSATTMIYPPFEIAFDEAQFAAAAGERVRPTTRTGRCSDAEVGFRIPL